MKSSLVALFVGLGLTWAESFCSNNVVYVTVTPTETITCGGTIYTTTTKTTTLTVQPSETSESVMTVVQTVYISPSPIAKPSSSILEAASSASPFTSSKVTYAGSPTSLSFVFASTAAAEATGKNEAVSAAAISTPKASSTKASASAAAASTSSSNGALSGSNSGEATYYGGNTSGGMCSFSTYSLPSGLFGTALSDSNWDAAGNCGACISVTGPSGNSIKAMIVDQCPGCGENHLDLFPDAFAALAEPSKGVIDVSWSIVPCDITSPFVLHNKDGTSQYWFSMQVVNANVPVSTLEVSTDGGVTWQATTRQDYNFFEHSAGFGTETVDVRVTSITGEKVVVKGVSVASSTSVEASSNFS